MTLLFSLDEIVVVRETESHQAPFSDDSDGLRRCSRCGGAMRLSGVYRLGLEVERLANCGEDWTCGDCGYGVFLPTWRSMFVAAVAGVIAFAVAMIPLSFLIPDLIAADLEGMVVFLLAMFMTFAIAVAVLIYAVLQVWRSVWGVIVRVRCPYVHL